MGFNFNADYFYTYINPENDKLVDAFLLPRTISRTTTLPNILVLSQP